MDQFIASYAPLTAYQNLQRNISLMQYSEAFLL